jgi:hypothetical protein
MTEKHAIRVKNASRLVEKQQIAVIMRQTLPQVRYRNAAQLQANMSVCAA